MIVDILILIIGTFLSIVITLLSVINYSIPPQFENALLYYLSPLQYLSGYIDIQTIFSAIGVVSSFLGFYYTVKFSLWLYSIIPFVGKQIDLPFGGGGKEGESFRRNRHKFKRVDPE